LAFHGYINFCHDFVTKINFQFPKKIITVKINVRELKFGKRFDEK